MYEYVSSIHTHIMYACRACCVLRVLAVRACRGVPCPEVPRPVTCVSGRAVPRNLRVGACRAQKVRVGVSCRVWNTSDIYLNI